MYQRGSNNCSVQITGFVHYLQANVMCHFKIKIFLTSYYKYMFKFFSNFLKRQSAFE